MYCGLFLACWQSFLFQILVGCCVLFLCFLVEFVVPFCLFDVSLLFFFVVVVVFVVFMFVCCFLFFVLFSLFVVVVWWGVVTLLCCQRVLDPESIELLQNPADTTLTHYDYTSWGVWACGG